jgi:hypothetical protein
MTLAVASNVHRRKAVWGSKAAGFALALAVAASASCGKTREGTGNSFLIMTALEGAAGDAPTEFGGTLRSDVITVVEDVPTVFNDIGRARFTLGLKDPGTASAPTVPSQFDFITINRYRVRFVRADGRNTPGVDVPFGFDGAVTVTVTGGETTAGFEIVRHSLKQEAPLAALAFSGVIIATIAEVTFYGQDQSGREVTVSGRMTIDFGNFGDS